MKLFKKILRFFLGFIIFLIVLLVVADIGFLFWLKSNPDKIASYIEKNTGGKVEIGGVSGEFFFGFTAKDILVLASDNPTDQRLLRAGHVEIDLSWAQLLKLKTFPTSVRMDDFDLYFTVDKNGKLVFPEFTKNLAQGGQKSGALDLPGDIKIHLSHGSIFLNWHLKDIPTLKTGVTQVNGKGIFRKTGEIKIRSLEGISEVSENPLFASGVIDPFDSKSLNLEIQGESIDVLELISMFPSITRQVPRGMLPSGQAGGVVMVFGPFNSIDLKGDLTMPTGRLANLNLGSAELQFEYADKNLKLNDLSAKAYGGIIDLSSEVRFDIPRPGYTFTIDFSKVNVGSYLTQIGLHLQGAVGEFHGTFEGAGEFGDPKAFIAQGNFTSQGGTYRSPFGSAMAESLERFDYNALRVDFETAEGIISIKNLLLESDELNVVARGTIDSTTTLDMRGQMEFPRQRALTIPKFKKWADAFKAYPGRIILDFTLKGDIKKPKVTATPAIKVLEVFKAAKKDILGWFGALKNGLPD